MLSQQISQFEPPLKLGEGPIYRAKDSTLHFNDLLGKKVHVLPIVAETGEVDSSRNPVVHETADYITFQCFQEGKTDKYLCLYFQGIGELDEKTGELTRIKVLCPDRTACRMNDGIIDPKGRLWAGELDFAVVSEGIGFKGEPKGKLWRFDLDGSVHCVDGGLAISNGLGFSPDHTTMYLNDSLAQLTYAFDFDVESGEISNRRVVRDFRSTKSEPDGLVVDTQGNIWTALYNGSAILCMDPQGKMLHEVAIDALAPSCPTWGGKNNDILFVTTAGGDGKGDGQIFKIQTDVQGMPTYDRPN